MTIPALFVILVSTMAFAALLALVYITTRRRFVECPETGTIVRVSVDCRQAAKAVLTRRHLRVVDCERWPERQDCDRSCEHTLYA